MGLTGLTIFAFLVLHLKTFFLPHKVGIGQKNAETLWDEAQWAFSSPAYVAIYVVAMTLLAFHLAHGFQSSFQTLGARHPKYTPFIKGLGYSFAIIVPALFALIPVYMYLHHTLKVF
jgi:succinate dehydrogenase / fumarate reductase cytochrome b subunit